MIITTVSERLPVRSEEDIVRVRQYVKKYAIEIKFSLVEQTKFVTAASEIARNTLIYGMGGICLLEILDKEGQRGIRLMFEDQGPGIPDVDQALRDGFTSGKGMGLGLGGAKRLVDEFSIKTQPNEGTSVTLLKWK